MTRNLFAVFIGMVTRHVESATDEEFARANVLFQKVQETTQGAKRGDLLMLTALMATSLAEDFLSHRDEIRQQRERNQA